VSLLRVGTRGSELARRQTDWVVRHLRMAAPGDQFEVVVVTTHGDTTTQNPTDKDWPLGGFVSTIEQALLEGRVDIAVHSYKDLPTTPTDGLVVAAVPRRELPRDVLVTRESADWRSLPAGFRIGTGSPRRAAQFRRLGGVEIVPVRGNVPTRVAKVEEGLVDGVVLAAAGLARLGMNVPIRIDLPVDEFVPAPAQGALAVQVGSSSDLIERVRLIEDEASRKAVQAERAFLQEVGTGCHVPVGALASVTANQIALRGQLFTPAIRSCSGAGSPHG